MGGERIGKRKFLLFSAAGLILVLAFGCAQHRVQPAERDDCRQVRQLDAMISRGEFDAAARRYQDMLSAAPRSPLADVALYNLGLISAHSANPKKDYKRSLAYFTRIEKEYPASPLAEESRIWAGVLHAFEKANQVDIEIQQKKMGLGK